MKRFIYILVSGLLLACSGYKIIPDEQLALIFHDAFLSNAYMQHRGMRPDSLNLYEPIFAKYGYTTADVQYTIGNFSKRKSARLSDVVEQAIKLLETEAEHLDREVSILDTIDNVARRTFRRTLYADSARPRHAAARHGAAPFRLRQHPSGRLYDRVRLSDRFARREYAAACQRLVRAGRRPSGQCVADLSDTPPCGGVPPRDEGRHFDAAAGARSLRDPQSETQATAHDRPQSAGGLYPRCRRGGRQPLPASVEHQDFCR